MRHVIVTGGSRGLGLAIVESLLDAGYRVSALSRTTSDALDALRARGDTLGWHGVDVADREALKACMDEIAADGLDALVNNAGIAAEGIFATFPPAELDRLIDTNLKGAMEAARLAVRRMLRQPEGGRIVNISSIIGLSGYRGLAAYAATKAGLDGFTRALAREVGPRRITVNAIAPGYLESDMSDALDSGQMDQIVRRTPLGRLGRPADVTGAVRFLLSDDAAFITGQTLVVDGGLTC